MIVISLNTVLNLNTELQQDLLSSAGIKPEVPYRLNMKN